MAKLTPAQIQRSVSPDALMSFEDGRSYKTLRPHLAKLGLTPEAYREKWGLPQNYPMVAQAFSDQSSKRARRRGFGQKHDTASAQASEAVAEELQRSMRSRSGHLRLDDDLE